MEGRCSIRDKNPKGRSIMSKIGSREKMIINSHDSYSCPMYDISQVGVLWRHVPMMGGEYVGTYIVHFFR